MKLNGCQQHNEEIPMQIFLTRNAIMCIAISSLGRFLSHGGAGCVLPRKVMKERERRTLSKHRGWHHHEWRGVVVTFSSPFFFFFFVRQMCWFWVRDVNQKNSRCSFIFCMYVLVRTRTSTVPGTWYVRKLRATVVLVPGMLTYEVGIPRWVGTCPYLEYCTIPHERPKFLSVEWYINIFIAEYKIVEHTNRQFASIQRTVTERKKCVFSPNLHILTLFRNEKVSFLTLSHTTETERDRETQTETLFAASCNSSSNLEQQQQATSNNNIKRNKPWQNLTTNNEQRKGQNENKR